MTQSPTITRPPLPARSSQRYAQDRQILEAGALAQQQRLAASPDAAPEMLYYLASHEAAEVRMAVAANPATPIHADRTLAADPVEDIRRELAGKIGRLMPHLGEGAKAQLREQAIAILEALAQDQAPRVRAVLADALKREPRIPRDLALQLAHDPELLVCGPILEYSPLLADHDLKEVLAASQVKGAMEHVARRPQLSADLSDTIAHSGDVAAVAALLSNTNAQLREDTLDAILDNAPANEAWHEPLAMRANLSIRAMKRIAGFVAAALVDRMVETHDIAPDVAHDLLMTVRERLDSTTVDSITEEEALAEASALAGRGAIDDAWVETLLDQKRRTLLIAGLSVISGLPIRATRKIIASRAGRAVTALCWKAGLTARTAYEVQQRLAHVSPAQLVVPEGGTDYPLKPGQMEWLLETFEDG